MNTLTMANFSAGWRKEVQNWLLRACTDQLAHTPGAATPVQSGLNFTCPVLGWGCGGGLALLGLLLPLMLSLSPRGSSCSPCCYSHIKISLPPLTDNPPLLASTSLY